MSKLVCDLYCNRADKNSVKVMLIHHLNKSNKAAGSYQLVPNIDFRSERGFG